MKRINEEMRKKGAASTKGATIKVENAIIFRQQEDRPENLIVVDEEMQKKFPRLAVLPTQTIPVSDKNNFRAILRDSEPKLQHDR